MTFAQIIDRSEHATIADRYRKGNTLEQIGSEYGVSRERIRQIVAKLGVKSEDGGAAMRSFAKVAHKPKNNKSELRCLNSYGCSLEVLLSINGGLKVSAKGAPAHRYLRQKTTARHRGIGFDLTLPEWWEIWQASGKYEQRGRGKGYVMTRIGDTGPYSKDNVEIKTGVENASESYYKTSMAERISKRKTYRKNLCVNGHERTAENVTKSGNCRICQRAADARRRANKLSSQQAAA